MKVHLGQYGDILECWVESDPVEGLGDRVFPGAATSKVFACLGYGTTQMLSVLAINTHSQLIHS
ncbi:hypothetical protein FHS27_005608 [Rhodopirellula rubra]|uniref:Uncharacterized protein n=1 Tax=Aporhodopirellula rubra TaxID=980271 RepID=A0A7W5H8S4_9BACT|nr:hypothetical protein [Aporhodopirellula rubra]